MTPTDRDALERAVELCRAESAASRSELTTGWPRATTGPISRRPARIIASLPRCIACRGKARRCCDIDRPRRDQHAAELLRRLLDAGLSRYEPNPIAALERAEAKRVATAAR